jgi:hypothetical protein
MNNKLIIYVLLLIVFCSSCASDNSAGSEPPGSNEYVKLNVDGLAMLFHINDAQADNRATLIIEGNKFKLSLYSYASAGNDPYNNYYEMVFDKQGNLFSFIRWGYGLGNAYFNYKNFPAHYFHLNITSIDEINKNIKGNFSGKIFKNELSLSSESNELSGEFLMNYQGDETVYTGIEVHGVRQHCEAKFNGIPWAANFENNSAFTAQDPYKIILHFDVNAQPGSYNITPASSDNYISFSKFNVETLVYDQYNVTGVLSHSYREYHGFDQYSYVGTFSFTAVNPNNPADVIQVSEGSFSSYQQF